MHFSVTDKKVSSRFTFQVCMLLVSVDKKKVLHHHPDKRRARGLSVKDGEDDYFTCITRGNFVCLC